MSNTTSLPSVNFRRTSIESASPECHPDINSNIKESQTDRIGFYPAAAALHYY